MISQNDLTFSVLPDTRSIKGYFKEENDTDNYRTPRVPKYQMQETLRSTVDFL